MARLHVGLLGVVLLTGCRSHVLSRAYTPQPAVVQTPKTELLLVDYPEDNRPLKGKSRTWPGMMILIPIVPYGHSVASPELYMRGRFRFTYAFAKDLQDVVLKDIQSSGLAKTVRAGGRDLKDVSMKYSLASGAVEPSFEWEGTAGTRPKGSKTLSLRIDEGVMNQYLTSYCLSIAAAPLWIFGAPVSFSNIDLQVTAELKDDQGRVIAQQAFTRIEPYWEWLYNNGAGLRVLPDAYANISDELRTFLKKNL